jgi:hypothetical protein
LEGYLFAAVAGRQRFSWSSMNISRCSGRIAATVVGRQFSLRKANKSRAESRYERIVLGLRFRARSERSQDVIIASRVLVPPVTPAGESAEPARVLIRQSDPSRSDSPSGVRLRWIVMH